jgi:hypothetical protein
MSGSVTVSVKHRGHGFSPCPADVEGEELQREIFMAVIRS